MPFKSCEAVSPPLTAGEETCLLDPADRDLGHVCIGSGELLEEQLWRIKWR